MKEQLGREEQKGARRLRRTQPTAAPRLRTSGAGASGCAHPEWGDLLVLHVFPCEVTGRTKEMVQCDRNSASTKGQ